MNLLRKLSFSLVFVLAALSLRAQAVIDLSAYIDDETPAAQLGDNNAAALKNKISKIITRNGMADAAGLFVVTPTLYDHRRRGGRYGDDHAARAACRPDPCRLSKTFSKILFSEARPYRSRPTAKASKPVCGR